MSDADTELLDIVDENDRVVRAAPRRRVIDEYHIHRAVMFFVFDREGRVYVNQRSQTKEIYPSYWSIAFGGHVRAGESYDAAAMREVQEETGLLDRPLPVTTFKKRTADERENVTVYRVTASREPYPYPEEIAQGEFVTLAELSARQGRLPFLPETPDLMRILFEHTAHNESAR